MKLLKKEVRCVNHNTEDAILELYDLETKKHYGMRYQLVYTWTVAGDSTRVKGQDISYWTRNDVLPVLNGQSLFDTFRLFP